MPPRRLSFSQRYGFTPAPEPVQLESVDERLRTDLWNVFYERFFKRYANPQPYSLLAIWCMHFGEHYEQFSDSDLAFRIKTTLLQGDWYEVYDLLEYIAGETPETSAGFVDPLNRVLTFNRAGYRIVAGEVVPITDETELQAIRDAAAQPAESPARQHIERAVQLFADRQAPQFANSIKESISAVEAAARDVAGKPSATLGDALDEIAKQPNASMHAALLKGWKAIYGFTSASGGIRHADSPGSVPATPELAQYFLVACSAMVNLLTTLQSKP